MFLKRFTFLAVFATVFTSATAQRLDATFDLVRFKAAGNQNMVELYCTVNGNSVNYQKVPGGFQASVALEVQFADSAGIKNFEKMLLRSPVTADTSKMLPAFNVQKRFALKNGKYTFSGTARDVNSTAKANSFEVPLVVDFQENTVQLSDIQLLESYEKTSKRNDYTKNGYQLVSYVSNFYPKGMDQLKFYAELYNTEAALGKDKPMVVFFRVFPTRDNLSKLTLSTQKIMTTAPVHVLLQDFAIGSLPSGNYEFVIEVRSEDNQILARQSRFFQRSNPQTETPGILAGPENGSLPPAFASLTDSLKLNLYLRSHKPI
ncbi:MAG TPA: hypothetical protein VK927_07640, partial [Adhaeribacter sp.]|nr:hypothetical protein [Adhaeribacter sp.]